MSEKKLTKKQAEKIAKEEDMLAKSVIGATEGTQKGRKAEAGKQSEKGKSNALKYMPYAVIVIIAAIIIYLVYFIMVHYVSTPFPTFLSNFKSGQRVAVVVSYGNNTQFSSEIPCYEALLEVIGGYKGVGNIDFFIVNSTNCTYSPTGFGANASVATVNASKCLSIAKSEPSVFLNYSQYNKTIITPYHLYVYGNSNYMRECGIAAEMSG